jgi:uncharacterized protein
VVRSRRVADPPAVLALNNASEPEVNAVEPGYFAWLVKYAAHFRVAYALETERGRAMNDDARHGGGARPDPGALAGFVLCLPSGCGYWSENYQWFRARHESYLYLDRVVVAPEAQGRGVGRALYEDLHRAVAGTWPVVTLEVNLRPPNPRSDAFHRALGYEPVGVREYESGLKAVTLYERAISG